MGHGLAKKLSLGIAMASALVAPALAQSPETIYINGKVYTADVNDRVVEAFAVGSDRFVAAGSTADIRKLAGNGTKVVDLKGHFVSPGLGDGHFHNEGGGTGIDLSYARSLAELFAMVANAAATT